MVLVVGGGASAAHHVRQLTRAVETGLVPGPLEVTPGDPAGARDALWRFLDAARPGDHVVPAPEMPHLLWEWLAERTGAEPIAAPAGWRLPFELAGPSGDRYLSAAAWTCPATCYEPAHCPVLHGPRDWDLRTVIGERAIDLGWRPAVLGCVHLARGVAAVAAGDLIAARAAVDRAAPGTRFLVATASHCHAALGGLVVGALHTATPAP